MGKIIIVVVYRVLSICGHVTHTVLDKSSFKRFSFMSGDNGENGRFWTYSKSIFYFYADRAFMRNKTDILFLIYFKRAKVIVNIKF